MLVAKSIENGHFALGTFSRTCLKDAVFDVNVWWNNVEKLKKSKMSILTWKSKIVSQPDIIFAQLTHSDIRQIIFSAFWNYIFLVLFWYIFGIYPVQNFFFPLYIQEDLQMSKNDSICAQYSTKQHRVFWIVDTHMHLSLIHIWRCRRSTLCRSRWSPYH